MSLEAAMLRAIVEEPDDDLHRLAYADLLEEKNDLARAEFIRVQIERARLHPDDDRQSDLEARERRLLLKHGRDWAPAVLPLEWTAFRRGFLEVLAPMPSWLTDENVADLGTVPIRDLRLYGHDGELDTGRIRELELLERIEALTLGDYEDPLTDGEMIDILESDRLKPLRKLELGTDDPDAALSVILGLAIVGEVEELDLTVIGMTNDEVRHLLSLPWPNLKRLRISGDNLDDVGYESLFQSSLWPRLDEIDLGRAEAVGGDIPLLASAFETMNARIVQFSGRSEAIEALCRATTWGRLECLSISGTHFEPGQLERCLAHPGAPNLRQLYVANCNLRASGATLLTQCPQLTNLTLLQIEEPAFFAALPRSRHLNRLRYLRGWYGTEAELIDYVQSPNAAHLRFLNASVWSDRVAAAIAGSPHMGRLTTLHSDSGRPLSDQAARLLAESPHLKNLTYLGLDMRQLSAIGQQALLEAKHLGWMGIDRDQLKSALLRRLWSERYGDGETKHLIEEPNERL